ARHDEYRKRRPDHPDRARALAAEIASDAITCAAVGLSTGEPAIRRGRDMAAYQEPRDDGGKRWPAHPEAPSERVGVRGSRGEGGDRRVALGEGPFPRWRVRWKLRDQRSARPDRVGEPPSPAARIREVGRDPGPEHGDGPSMRLERALVRRAVDPLRKPRDH